MTKDAQIGPPQHHQGPIRLHFTALCESCQSHGIPLKVLGWGQKWPGFAWRFSLFRDYLRTRPPTAIVAFVDAFDVIVLQDAAEILRRYNEITNGNNRVLLGVENPTGHPVMKYMHHRAFPQCMSHVINMGVYMGSAARLLDLLSIFESSNDKLDDEKLFNGACRDNEEFFRANTVVDVKGHVAFTVVCKSIYRYAGNGNCNNFSIDPSDLSNPLTGTVPCFLHVPGGMNMDPFCRTLGLSLGKRRPRLTWIWSNWWPEILGHILGTLFIVLLVIYWLWRRRTITTNRCQ